MQTDTTEIFFLLIWVNQPFKKPSLLSPSLRSSPLTHPSISLPFPSISSPSIFFTHSSLNHPRPLSPLHLTPLPWPPRAGQLQLWPAVRRLRQRLSVTPTGSQWCLAVVLAREWRVQSARRGGEPLTPWLLPRLALSRAEVSAEGLSSPLPPSLQVTIAIVVIAAIRADDTIIIPFCVHSL